ncbi:hypothetical protein ACFX2H_022101 [Malus domestica]
MTPRPQISDFNIYNDKKAAKRSTFLGKVKIPGNAFAKSDAAEFVYFSNLGFLFSGCSKFPSLPTFFNVSKISRAVPPSMGLISPNDSFSSLL